MLRMALLFPGQGAQYVGMGKILYENFDIAKQTFEEASEALGMSMKQLCFDSDIEKLTQTEYTQPAILTVGVAAFRVYMREIGIKPQYLAGHSIGEFTALVCADSIKFPDAVNLVNKRGKFMQKSVSAGIGAMAAIYGVDAAYIEEMCDTISYDDHIVVISNYNSAQQTVISGHADVVDLLGKELQSKGAKVLPLNVFTPFHSPLMGEAAELLDNELMQYRFDEIRIPVLSNITAAPYVDKKEIINSLSQQIVMPVRWHESMLYLKENGVGIAFEMGPGKILTKLLHNDLFDIKAMSLDCDGGIREVSEFLQTVQAGAKKSFLGRSLAIAVCTKNNNWDNIAYEKNVIEPYNKVQQLEIELDSLQKEPTIEQMKIAIKMLRSVFETKKTPIEERVERFRQLFNETGTDDLFHDYIQQVLE